MLTVEHVEFTIICHPETESIEGNVSASGDDKYDKKVEKDIYRQLEYNEWAWCCVEVVGEYQGLRVSEYLGGCSYPSKNDFIISEYYEDMKNNILELLKRKIKSIVESSVQLDI